MMNVKKNTFNYLEEFGINFKNHDYVEYFLWKAPNIDSRVAIVNKRLQNTFFSELLFRNLIKYLDYDYYQDVDISNSKTKCDLTKKITFRYKITELPYSALIRRIRNMLAHGYFNFNDTYCEFVNQWCDNGGHIKVDMEKVYNFVKEYEDIDDYKELVEYCLKGRYYIINVSDIKINTSLMMHSVRKIKIKSRYSDEVIDLVFFYSRESYVKKAVFVSFVDEVGLEEAKTAFICVNVDSRIRNFEFYKGDKFYQFIVHSRGAEFLYSLI